MCLAKVFVEKSNEPVMQEISRIRLAGDRVILENLFGESREISGTVREIDFMASRVFVEKSPAKPAG